MQSLMNPGLLDVMPASLKQDEKLVALAKALEVQLGKLSADSVQVLHLPRLDKLNGRVLDLLAWAFHVDNYLPLTLPDSTKRNLIRSSIAYHRRKGTRAAVDDVCTAFGTKHSIEEWFTVDDLEPYTFRLTASLKSFDKELESLIKRIWDAKNVRSWLVLRLKKLFEFKARIGIAHHRWGKKRILKRDRFTLADNKVTNVFSGRTFIIEPNKVTVLRGGQQTVLTPTLPKGKSEVTVGTRTIDIDNSKPDLTADDVSLVTNYAVEHDILTEDSEPDADESLALSELTSLLTGQDTTSNSTSTSDDDADAIFNALFNNL